jgi:hypothetical protein
LENSVLVPEKMAVYLSGDGYEIESIVHEAEEGGFWAEVPVIPGCATQGETFEELLEKSG